MQELQKRARALLEAGTVKVVIGYGRGSAADRVRALFACTPEQADQLIYNEHCVQNLVVYWSKPEVRALGKPAIVVRTPGLRTLLQLAVENQLSDDAVVALTVTDDQQLVELPTLAAIEEHLAQVTRGLTAHEQEEIAQLDRMSREERWAFWSAELSRCIKCYACRAACPLCYCERCVVEVNQPQWIPVAATELGNLEWNVVRAMHLAGRCINCGSCAAACPQHIRIDLLNHVLAQEALADFGAEAGYSRRKEYALAAFKPDDKEEFIR